ncbi:MAG: RNA polymerase sigma factor [Actinomycetes bacterium]
MSDWRVVLGDLVAQRRRHLIAYAVMLTGDPAEAEDVVQEALIAAFGGRRRFDNVHTAEAYVRRAIASRFIDERRRVARRARVAVAVAGVSPGAAPGPDASVPQLTDLERALQQLAKRERAVVVLRYLDQCSTRETAEALSLSEGAVKRYLSDGLARLNALLGTQDQASEPEVIQISSRVPTRGRTLGHTREAGQ